MAGRRTNLALLGLTGLALATGLTAFALGTPPGWFIVTAHSVVGLGLVLLTPWKRVVARRGMKQGGAGVVISLTLAAVAITTIASGVIQVSGLFDRIWGLTVMQVHVGAGVATVVLGVVHYLQRPTRPRKADLNRRNLIRVGGLLSAAAITYLVTETAWTLTSAPGAERRFTGSHEITDPSLVPATQWLNDKPPRLEAAEHRVSVAGKAYRVDRLAAFNDALEATLDCTGGWYTTQMWSGVLLDRLVNTDHGESLVVRSVTGYWRRFPIADAPELLLATHFGDKPLSAGHGAPVRLVAPGRRGFWWVKWVTSVDVDSIPPWWQPPLPLA